MTGRIVSMHHTFEDLRDGETARLIKGCDVQVGDVLKCWAGDFLITSFDQHHPTSALGPSRGARGETGGGRIGMTVFDDETAYVKEVAS